MYVCACLCMCIFILYKNTYENNTKFVYMQTNYIKRINVKLRM